MLTAILANFIRKIEVFEMKDNFPKCVGPSDCFGNQDGYCRVLKPDGGTDFGGKPCPFYKTHAQCAAERQETTKRLCANNRADLLDKYYGKDNSQYGEYI